MLVGNVNPFLPPCQKVAPALGTADSVCWVMLTVVSDYKILQTENMVSSCRSCRQQITSGSGKYRAMSSRVSVVRSEKLVMCTAFSINLLGTERERGIDEGGPLHILRSGIALGFC